MIRKGDTSVTSRNARIALAAMAVVCALVLAGRRISPERTIPEPLHGIWTSDSPRMTDRYLRLTRGLVIYGQGQGREQVCPVDRVESAEAAAGESRFTIHYRDDDGRKSALDFTFQPGAGGTIRLVNRPEVWRRSGGEVRI